MNLVIWWHLAARSMMPSLRQNLHGMADAPSILWSKYGIHYLCHVMDNETFHQRSNNDIFSPMIQQWNLFARDHFTINRESFHIFWNPELEVVSTPRVSITLWTPTWMEATLVLAIKSFFAKTNKQSVPVLRVNHVPVEVFDRSFQVSRLRSKVLQFCVPKWKFFRMGASPQLLRMILEAFLKVLWTITFLVFRRIALLNVSEFRGGVFQFKRFSRKVFQAPLKSSLVSSRIFFKIGSSFWSCPSNLSN